MTKIILPAILIFSFCTGVSGTERKSGLNEQSSYLKKFSAQKKVKYLSDHNLKEIKFIESLSLKYGYHGYRALKKEYYTAKMEIIRGDFILAEKMLKRNKKNIEDHFQEISQKYGKRCSDILSRSIPMVSSFHIRAQKSKNADMISMFKASKQRLDVAVKQLEEGDIAAEKGIYRRAIGHYRKAKSIALKIMTELSSPAERKKISEQYSIDIKDFGTDHF